MAYKMFTNILTSRTHKRAMIMINVTPSIVNKVKCLYVFYSRPVPRHSDRLSGLSGGTTHVVHLTHT